MKSLLVPREVDRLLRYPRGRALRLAKTGKLPCIRLPDGEIRFDEEVIERLLTQPVPEAAGEEVAHAAS